MVSAVQEEDSSSARDSLFFVENVLCTSSGLIKIVNSEGVSFFSRPEYFNDEDLEALKNTDTYLSEEQLSILLDAVQTYSAEVLARKYLGRAEHSKYQLKIKLKKKGFLDVSINPSLDYLEEQGILDDQRYARAWLNTRRIYKKEGRMRLTSELLSRGIDFSIAQKALKDFFNEHSELDICQKALEKQLNKGLEGQKLIRAMSRLGFSSQLINICLKENKSNIASS